MSTGGSRLTSIILNTDAPASAANGLHGSQPVAAGNGDLLPLPFLVGLAAADQHSVAVGCLGQIGASDWSDCRHMSG